MMTARASGFLKLRLRWIALGFFASLILFIGLSNYRVVSSNRASLFTAPDTLPTEDVALVLGANAVMRDGQPNLHFINRIEAAAELYRAGRVRHILVSGDNHRAGYDEPSMMKAALIARGVPAQSITCDFAGFRTLDSVIRAKKIFGLKHCVIVTQRYHNTRALEIARAIGLDAVGFCAKDVTLQYSFLTEAREILARTVTVLDLYVWHRQPHFLGRAEPIALAQS